jgi:hypothetical protein
LELLKARSTSTCTVAVSARDPSVCDVRVQGEPERAKNSAHAAAAMVFILAASASSLLLFARRGWANAFSPDDHSAADLIVTCMPLVCVYITLDAIGIGLLNSILRAVRFPSAACRETITSQAIQPISPAHWSESASPATCPALPVSVRVQQSSSPVRWQTLRKLRANRV